MAQIAADPVGTRLPYPVWAEDVGTRAGVSWLVPLGLWLVATALRLYRVDHESLWLDEGYTLLFSGLPFDRLISVGGAHEHPPLYYSIVHVLRSIHEWYLIPRYVSALAGSLAVPVLYLLGARLFGRVAGALAALLLIVSPFQVWYSQDGRGYELAGLLVLLSYLLIFIARDNSRAVTWCAYLVCTAAALYTEYTTLLVLLPQLVFLFEGRGRLSRRALLLSWVGAGLLFAPWIGVLAHDAATIAADYWIPAPTVSAVSNTALEYVGGVTPCPSPPCTGREVGVPFLMGNEAVVLVALTLFIAGVAVLAYRERDLPETVLVLWLVVPFAVVIAFAFKRSLYLDRVFLDATFPFYLLVAAVACRSGGIVWTRLIAAAVFVAILAASVCSLSQVYAGGINPDWKSAARDFAHAYRPGQAVVFNPGVLRSLLTSYLPAGWKATKERPMWSRIYVDVPGWESQYPVSISATDQERHRTEALLRERQLSWAARGQRQVWLITMDYSGMNDTRRWFPAHGFRPVLSEEYEGDTRIELWDRAPTAAFGRRVLGGGFTRVWKRQGHVGIRGATAALNGSATLTRSFSVTPGMAYAVHAEYRGIPRASKPAIWMQLYSREGQPLDIFPRTEWYDFPVNGVWLSQPLGFIAPPEAASAVIHLQNRWGECFWRHVSVYSEAQGARRT